MKKSSKSLSTLLIVIFSSVAGLFVVYKILSGLKSAPISSNPNLETATKPQSEENLAAKNESQNALITPSPTIEEIPEQKIITGKKHLFQTFNNCGPASLSMALSYHSFDVSQELLGNQLRPYQNPQGDNDDKSVTLQELAQVAEDNYDLIAYHRPSGNMDLLEKLIAADLPVITRTWLNIDEDIGHYRLVRAYDRNTQTLIQDDSLQGRGLSYSYEEFNQIWQAFNFEFLVLVPPSQQAEAERILGPLLNEVNAWKQAEQRAQQRVSEKPNDIYAQFNLLVAYYHQGDYQQAINIFEEIEKNLPARMLWYQIEPILAYFQVKDYSRVLSLTEQIFDSQNKAFSELHYLRGLIYQEQNQEQAAQTAFSLARDYNKSEYWQSNLTGIEL